MKIKNLKVSSAIIGRKNLSGKAKSLALVGVLGTVAMLSGCGNRDIMDTESYFNKAIIFKDDSATIIKIQKWSDYEGEQLRLITDDGLIIVTSSFDTKLINDKDSDITAEDFAKSILGDDAQINYLEETQNTKTK